jgi:hypothetical protein
MRPTLSPASAATSASTSASGLVELSPPVGEGPVLLGEAKEVAKVVGIAPDDCAGLVQSPQMPESVTLD